LVLPFGFASLILSRSTFALGFVRATTCVTALGSILASWSSGQLERR
jgi:hypothetical protein